MSLKQLNKDNKLAPNYYGPYKVLQKISSVAYKLEFSTYSWVHQVFHVSWLKKVIGDKIQTIFPKLDEEGKIILEPEQLTEIRTKQLWTRAIIEYLIDRKSVV